MCKTFFIYIKNYWSIFVLAVGALIGVLLFRKEKSDYVTAIKNIQETHDNELKQIKIAYEQERIAKEENSKKLKDALATIQKEYDLAKKDLDEKKKKEILDIIKSYKDDPNQLAKKLSEATGFSIILPQ